jgi:hypothetical protein
LAVLTNPPRLGILDRYPAVPNPMTVEPSCVARNEVLTKFAKFAVEICPAKFAVETKFAKLAVLTNPPRLGILERYPAVPNPITVEPSCVARNEVLTKFAKFAVEIWAAKFAVDTKFAKFAVEIWPAKFAVDTKFAKLAVLTNPPRLGILERYPAVPNPITVLARFAGERNVIPVIDETLSCCVESVIAVIVFAVIVIVLILVPIVSPVSVNPVPVPIKRALTVSELIVAVSEFTFAVLIFTVESDEVRKACDIIVEKPVDRYPADPRPITVEPSCVCRKVVDIKFAKLAVEIWLAKLAVEI